jgi:hypothetical protein
LSMHRTTIQGFSQVALIGTTLVSSFFGAGRGRGKRLVRSPDTSRGVVDSGPERAER